MSSFAALVATHAFAACAAWANGYLCGVYLERRKVEDGSWTDTDLVDLTEPDRVYDWAVDGEAAETLA